MKGKRILVVLGMAVLCCFSQFGVIAETQEYLKDALLQLLQVGQGSMAITDATETDLFRLLNESSSEDVASEQPIAKVSEESLLEAARNGSLAEVVSLLHHHGVDRRCRNADGNIMTALHFAAQRGYLELAKYLLQQGADIHCKDNCDWTPLHWSVHEGHLEVTKYLLQQGADIHYPDNEDWTPLHAAARMDRIDVVEHLLQQGVDIRQKVEEGYSPLHVSAYSGHLQMLKCLLESGADINPMSIVDKTPLHLAAQQGHLDVVSYLLQQGVDIHRQDYYGWTPLHFAANGGQLEVVKYLLQQGADRTANGRIPVTAAIADDIAEDVKEKLRLLLEPDGH